MIKKYVLCFLIGLFTIALTAQNQEEAAVKQTIEDFFKAFHKKDSLALYEMVHETIRLQTIKTSKDGQPVLLNEAYDTLVGSITKIPDTLKFEERILDYNIKIDGAMANAWTKYEFWFNNEFHHCGVNSFQLFKENNTWKIIYLIDTRRVEDCKASTPK
ncbi:nuclear transport factor 2 family protein [Maribacter confluentis]|uniref:Nuclear transport factor 2 family protein n=1 Tax=Maribacter confluentis TaxID=1656093 RepID=A0ABT8RL62_9FLAO|nr:nuclear transport factor 2 family protein [Maribacter confluentis]MDO1511202.1 nuclear transport factor 2 family protein [Maribacter confluentis]